MSKTTAVDTLTIKISKADMTLYSNELYKDIADPLLNGIAAHNADPDAHGLPAIIAEFQDLYTDLLSDLDNKVSNEDFDLSTKANRSGDTFTGTVTINTDNDHIILNGAVGTRRAIYSRTSGLNRWEIAVATNEPELGSNTGSNFSIERFADDGNYIGNPLSIDRATGVVHIESLVIGSGGILQDSGLDIRRQYDEPTENLHVGTVWLRTERPQNS